MNTTALYLQTGIIGGKPDSINDADVLAILARIVNHPHLTKAQKYQCMDALTFKVWNCHPHGIAARVLDEISEAIENLGGK
jgi:hypothetical protein